MYFERLTVTIEQMVAILFAITQQLRSAEALAVFDSLVPLLGDINVRPGGAYFVAKARLVTMDFFAEVDHTHERQRRFTDDISLERRGLALTNMAVQAGQKRGEIQAIRDRNARGGNSYGRPDEGYGADAKRAISFGDTVRVSRMGATEAEDSWSCEADVVAVFGGPGLALKLCQGPMPPSFNGSGGWRVDKLANHITFERILKALTKIGASADRPYTNRNHGGNNNNNNNGSQRTHPALSFVLTHSAGEYAGARPHAGAPLLTYLLIYLLTY
jgi:hypothetical protein